jgi:GT2 family glycosyltransferase
MENLPLVSIVTINYNQALVTNLLLESLQKITWKNTEIIVVDNCSLKQDFDLLNRTFENVKIIETGQNLGYAGGNNAGLINSTGSYILFINNDTEVDPGFIEPMIDAFRNDDNLGLVSPKIKFFYSEGKNTLQYAGGTKPDKVTGLSSFIGYGKQDNGNYDKSEYTQMIHGAAVMVPRKLLENVGVWPDVYFLYYEEIDWASNFIRNGYKLKYVHDSVVYHKESVSVGKSNQLKTYFMSRNRLLFFRRNLVGVQKIIAFVYFMGFNIPKTMVKYILKNDRIMLNAYWKGLIWNVKHVNLPLENPLLVVENGSEKIINSFYKNYHVYNN